MEGRDGRGGRQGRTVCITTSTTVPQRGHVGHHRCKGSARHNHICCATANANSNAPSVATVAVHVTATVSGKAFQHCMQQYPWLSTGRALELCQFSLSCAAAGVVTEPGCPLLHLDAQPAVTLERPNRACNQSWSTLACRSFPGSLAAAHHHPHPHGHHRRHVSPPSSHRPPTLNSTLP